MYCCTCTVRFLSLNGNTVAMQNVQWNLNPAEGTVSSASCEKQDLIGKGKKGRQEEAERGEGQERKGQERRGEERKGGVRGRGVDKRRAAKSRGTFPVLI